MNAIVFKCAQTELWINSPGSGLNRCIADATATLTPTLFWTLVIIGFVLVSIYSLMRGHYGNDSGRR